MCKRLSKEIVNERLRNDNRTVELIGNFYYSRSKSLFKCNKCDYEWMAIVSNIINNKRGCPYCSKQIFLTKEIINERIKNKNIELIGKYYSVNKKSEFKCLSCNNNWITTPNSVMYNTGCPICNNGVLNKEFYANKLLEQNRSIIMIGNYFGSDKKTLFKCLKCNNEWLSSPTNVVTNKRGCSICAKYSFKKDKPAILYYIKLNHNDKDFYKIGITNRTIKERFNKENIDIEIIFSKLYDKGNDAYIHEQNILEKLDQFRYNGTNILKSGGNKEIFIKDIRELININV